MSMSTILLTALLVLIVMLLSALLSHSSHLCRALRAQSEMQLSMLRVLIEEFQHHNEFINLIAPSIERDLAEEEKSIKEKEAKYARPS
jgi:protoheme ferro-lyase